MNYPIWWTPWAGGGLLIALIAVVHVFVAHFAVGGGLFLPLLERKAYRENSPAILAYAKSHTKFFLLLTMVFGGITGVGIWFIIQLVSPAATSVLIHIFVWGWAAEWVFFLVEIVALLIYFYTYDRMRPTDHFKIGVTYFVFGWLSLFVINGVIGFMLTPGDWLVTGNFWSGFFNPTFWPSLLFRTCLALIIAGLFGLLTAVRTPEPDLRKTLVRFAVRFIAWPFSLLLVSLVWYLNALPEPQRLMVTTKSSEMPPLLLGLLLLTPALFLGGLVMLYAAQHLAKAPRTWLAYALVGLGLVHMGFFEWTREAARRPYLIRDHLYSTALTARDIIEADKRGLLKTARWVQYKNITPQNTLKAGRELFAIQCLPCHSIGGAMLDILPRSAHLTQRGLESQLQGQGKLRVYMPPFAGTQEERAALAAYIVQGLHKRQEKASAPASPASPASPAVPDFDPTKDEYALLAWASSGMRPLTDCDALFSLAAPGLELSAQLVKRGQAPELVEKDVTVTYAVEKGFENPAAHVRFWEFSAQFFPKPLEVNRGASGRGVMGAMEFKTEQRRFAAADIPVVPYPDQGGYNPFPTFIIEARETKSGHLLASTRLVATAASEMGCANCHAGGERFPADNPGAGLSNATARSILAAHDRLEKTALAAQANAGWPQRCQNCHADASRNLPGKPKRLALSASVHGFHANYMPGQGAEACGQCHPAEPKGASRCYRSVHASRGLDCTRCHGALEDHALGLLKNELAAGKPAAERLMKHLKTSSAPSFQALAPRQPWRQTPDCGACHDLATKPGAKSQAVGAWTKKEENLYHNRRDDLNALACPACHNAAHAEYPAATARDNVQPLQYQKSAKPIGADGDCSPCHTEEMADFAHHPLPGK